MKIIWSGIISFGLINMPVNLYPGSKLRRLPLDYLRKSDKCPVGYQYVCKNSGEKVDYKNIIRGFEYKKGEYVVLESDDFEKASNFRNKIIEILNFIDEKEVESKYYQKPYYLEPQKNGEKIYALLIEVMKRSGKAGLVRFMIRTIPNIGIIKAKGGMLLLNQIRYESQINPTENLKLPQKADLKEEEINLGIKLVKKLSSEFKPKDYKDNYKNEILEIINRKIIGQEIEKKKLGKPEPTEVSDILVRLSESLGASSGRGF